MTNWVLHTALLHMHESVRVQSGKFHAAWPLYLYFRSHYRYTFSVKALKCKICTFICCIRKGFYLSRKNWAEKNGIHNGKLNSTFLVYKGQTEFCQWFMFAYSHTSLLLYKVLTLCWVYPFSISQQAILTSPITKSRQLKVSIWPSASSSYQSIFRGQRLFGAYTNG